MALRDQPYFPLYVQDYLTDEKLNMCTWSTQGVYIKLLCLFHKSDPYGTILLKQKDKLTQNIAYDFAIKISKLLPIDKDKLHEAIKELIEEGCLTQIEDKLFQKRMVRDNEISLLRADAGKKGGLKTKFAKAKAKAKGEANPEAEAEDEDENGIDYDNIVENYHFLCPKLSKVQILNDTRKGYINARVSEFGLQKVIEVLRLVGESDFLNGKNDRAWKADLEWIMRPTNFIKIMEGKYTNRVLKPMIP
jgi:hypothetical protein